MTVFPPRLLMTAHVSRVNATFHTLSVRSVSSRTYSHLPGPFALSASFMYLLMVVVGGQGYFLGPFLGALVAVALPEYLRFTGGYYLLVFAAFVLVLLILCPTGLVGLAEKAVEALRRSKSREERGEKTAEDALAEPRK